MLLAVQYCILHDKYYFPPVVDLNGHVTRFPNGSVLLTWQIPPELRDSPQLSVEVDWGEGFVPVTPGLHSPAHLDPTQEYTVQLRLRQGKWEGSLFVPVPAIATEEPTEEAGTEDPTPSRGEVAILYSVVFGTVIVACSILLFIILSLKYVQWSRRDSDKGEGGEREGGEGGREGREGGGEGEGREGGGEGEGREERKGEGRREREGGRREEREGGKGGREKREEREILNRSLFSSSSYKFP